jgi:hypothetical protein
MVVPVTVYIFFIAYDSAPCVVTDSVIVYIIIFRFHKTKLVILATVRDLLILQPATSCLARILARTEIKYL